MSGATWWNYVSRNRAKSYDELKNHRRKGLEIDQNIDGDRVPLAVKGLR